MYRDMIIRKYPHIYTYPRAQIHNDKKKNTHTTNKNKRESEQAYDNGSVKYILAFPGETINKPHTNTYTIHHTHNLCHYHDICFHSCLRYCLRVQNRGMTILSNYIPTYQCGVHFCGIVY